MAACYRLLKKEAIDNLVNQNPDASMLAYLILNTIKGVEDRVKAARGGLDEYIRQAMN